MDTCLDVVLDGSGYQSRVKCVLSSLIGLSQSSIYQSKEQGKHFLFSKYCLKLYRFMFNLVLKMFPLN